MRGCTLGCGSLGWCSQALLRAASCAQADTRWGVTCAPCAAGEHVGWYQRGGPPSYDSWCEGDEVNRTRWRWRRTGGPLPLGAPSARHNARGPLDCPFAVSSRGGDCRARADLVSVHALRLGGAAPEALLGGGGEEEGPPGLQQRQQDVAQEGGPPRDAVVAHLQCRTAGASVLGPPRRGRLHQAAAESQHGH
jgi:hypothetical protein